MDNFIEYALEKLNNTDAFNDLSVKRGLWEIHHRESDRDIIHADEIFKSNMNTLVTLHPYAANSLNYGHTHDFFELAYMAKGSCTQRINGIELDMSEGDICLLSPSSEHILSTHSPNDVLINIIIKKSLLNASFMSLISENDMMSHFFITSMMQAHQADAFLFFSKEKTSDIQSLIHHLVVEFCEANMCYKKSMEFYLALIFTEFLRLYRESMDEHFYEKSGNNDLSAILKYITTHLSDVSLTTVSEYFGYHPNYLSSLIKQHTNLSFTAFLKKTKIQEACHQLSHSTLSVDTIATGLGFYDRSHFHRVFRSEVGMTPMAYRKDYR